MASAAEQMAANLSWGALGKATDLRQRIFFTIGLLIVYRLGTYIPVPGIDGDALRDVMAQVSQGIGGMLNLFTGGAISRMGIFALGIMPYISASIIVQLLSTMYGPLAAAEERRRAGPQEAEPVHPLWHGRAGDPAGLRHRRVDSGRAGWRIIPGCSSSPPASSRWSAARCS